MAHKSCRRTEAGGRRSSKQIGPLVWDKSSTSYANVDEEELAGLIRRKVSCYVEGMKASFKLGGNLESIGQGSHVPELTVALRRLVQAERDRGMLLRAVLKELEEVTQGLRVANAAKVLKQSSTLTALELRRTHRRSLRE
eukprot:6433951-Amphidinium_carterae.1